MRLRVLLFILPWLLTSCDSSRVYEQNEDLVGAHWMLNNPQRFEFQITDTISTYNLYCAIRNTSDYPFSRIFIASVLSDSLNHNIVPEHLISAYLFDPKSGKPNGASALGDIYSHRIELERSFVFPHSGKFTIELRQQMRTDTLAGIVTVGFRVERN